jgi:uncharacterized protein (TIGR02588 family)
MSPPQRNVEQRKVKKNPLEWAVFTVSLLAILATVGFLIRDAVTDTGSPPDLRIELGPPEARSGVFAVPVTVRNVGDETAEGVRVEVVSEAPGRAPERAEIEMAFVPRRSQREGWVTFRQDPRPGRLTGRAVGYEKP